MKKPKAIVISGDGINCESETRFGLDLAGFQSQECHIAALLANPKILNNFSLLVLPGGFSFGDEIASGKVIAIKWMEKLNEITAEFIEQGKLVIGICNGFQMLVQMNLLPEMKIPGEKIVSLVHNSGGRFINRWVEMTVPINARKGFFASLEKIELPIRHGEGRIRPAAGHEDLIEQHGVLNYVEDINGSFKKIAALTNTKGNVLGLMPHPEAYVRFSQHPGWTDRIFRAQVPANDELFEGRGPDGLAILKNACTMAQNN